MTFHDWPVLITIFLRAKWCGGKRQRSVSGQLCMDGDLFVIGRSKTTNHSQSRGCKSSGRNGAERSTDLSLKRWFRGSQSKSTNAPWDSCYLLRVPLLHNRLSRQLGQLSTPPTLFSLCPLPFFLPSSPSFSLLSSPSESLLFQPHLSVPSFLFWQTPSSALFCCLSFLSKPIPLCVTYSLRQSRPFIEKKFSYRTVHLEWNLHLSRLA